MRLKAVRCGTYPKRAHILADGTVAATFTLGATGLLEGHLLGRRHGLDLKAQAALDAEVVELGLPSGTPAEIAAELLAILANNPTRRLRLLNEFAATGLLNPDIEAQLRAEIANLPEPEHCPKLIGVVVIPPDGYVF